MIAYAAVQLAGATPVVIPESMGTERSAQAARSARAVAAVGPVAIGDLPGWSCAELAPGGAFPLISRISSEAEIIFTSGTTGTPKAVVATHGNVLAAHAASRPRNAPQVVVLHSIAAGSIGAQGLVVQPLDPRPHTVVTLPMWDADTFLAAASRHCANHLVLVPAQAADLIAASPRPCGLPSVEVVRVISAACPPAVLAGLQEMLPGADIITMYTSTEAFPARLRLRFDSARPTAVGRSADVRGTQVRVVDDAGHAVPPDTAGHVHLRCDGVARRRYEGDDQANSAVFLADGWIATGDVGELDSEGLP
jgi:long-chain acyl-CoA synthetase